MDSIEIRGEMARRDAEKARRASLSQESPIAIQIQNLNQLIADLEATTTDLITQLQPIMGKEQPEEKVKSTVESPSEVCDLELHLIEATHRVCRTRELMKETIELLRI